MRTLFALFVTSAAWTFCACSGGGGGGLPPLQARYEALMASVNAQSLGSTMSHYSTSYMNDCSTWTDVQSGWQSIFTEPNYTLTLSNLVVTNQWTNNQTLTGHLTATVTVTENNNGVITNEVWAISMPFRREGSAWRLFGDQSCTVAAANWRDNLRTLLGANEDR